METYSVNCKKNKLILLSNCAVCGNQNSNFIKNQELHNISND